MWPMHTMGGWISLLSTFLRVRRSSSAAVTVSCRPSPHNSSTVGSTSRVSIANCSPRTSGCSAQASAGSRAGEQSCLLSSDGNAVAAISENALGHKSFHSGREGLMSALRDDNIACVIRVVVCGRSHCQASPSRSVSFTGSTTMDRYARKFAVLATVEGDFRLRCGVARRAKSGRELHLP